MIKTAIHNGLTCEFRKEDHIYTIKETGQVLTSGTTFIKQFLPKFDTPVIAQETAIKRGTTAKALIKEWKEAADEGDFVHSYAEWIHNDVELPPYPIEANRVGLLTCQLLKACDKLREKGFEVIEPEKIIFSPMLGLAGQIDLLLRDPAGRIIILDWKTCKKLTLDNPFQNCLEPIEHLEDANLNHYALQLSVYQYIFDVEKYFPAGQEYRRLIVHLTENDNKIYSCKFLEDEIEAMFI